MTVVKGKCSSAARPVKVGKAISHQPSAISEKNVYMCIQIKSFLEHHSDLLHVFSVPKSQSCMVIFVLTADR